MANRSDKRRTGTELDGQVAAAESPLEHVEGMLARARSYEAAAHAAGDVRGALRALRESRAAAEFIAKLTGAFREPVEPEVQGRYIAEWGVPLPGPNAGRVADLAPDTSTSPPAP